MREEIRRRLAVVPGWGSRFAPVPWLVRASCAFARPSVAHIAVDLGDLVDLVVSQDNSCRYCYGAQRSLMKVLGYRDATIEQLERDFHVAPITPAYRAALDFTRKLSRADPRPDGGDYAQLVGAGFSPVAIAEIAICAAGTLFMNRVATLAALPPEPFERAVNLAVFPLLRPVVEWWLKSRKREPWPALRSAAGPCARVVAALGDTRSASAVRATIDEAWASTVLPLRTKLLMLAVVGKALGCQYAVGEARAQLTAGGFPAADVDDVLTNLASPRLDAREALLVPFARETTHRSNVAALQDRARAVTTGFSPAEMLETFGMLALANTICRLSVLLDAG